MILYLSRNKTIAVLIVVSFYLGMVYFHDAATVVADWLKYRMTLPYYNIFLLATGLIFALITGYYLWKKVSQYPERRVFFYGFLLTLALIFQSYFTMMVVNMEAVHFIQYAMLAILLFPITRRFENAFILAAILGVADEIYQYLMLNPDFKYFDFNDILLNMLGAGSGLIFIAITVPLGLKIPHKWYRSSSFFFILAIVLLGIIFSLGHPVSFFPVTPGQEQGHWFSLYRKELSDSFWTPLYDNRVYHIFRPWEGIASIILLTAFYSRLDSKYYMAVTNKN